MTLEDDVLLYGVYMVLMDSRSGTYDITDDVIIFVTTLRLNISETTPDSGMVTTDSL